MESKFEKLAESTMVRFQQGGILVGDLVRFKKDIVNNPKLKNITDQMRETILQVGESGLNLRVSAIKSIRPSSSGTDQTGATESPTDFWVDVVVEYAPGNYSTPFTIPVEVVEQVDTHGNLAPIPDELKREGDVNIKPEEVEIQLTVKNIKIPFGDGPVTEDSEDSDVIGDLYSEMHSRKYNCLTVAVPSVFSENISKYLTTEGYSITKTYLEGCRVNFEVETDKKEMVLEKELQENVLGQFAYIVVSDAKYSI